MLRIARIDPRLILGIAGMVIFAFCGGLMYMSFDMLTSMSDLKAKASPVANQALEEMGNGWRTEAVYKWVQRDTGDPQKLSAQTASYRTKFGSLVEHGPFRFGKFKVRDSGEAGNAINVSGTCSAHFQKRVGTVTLTLIRQNSKWSVSDFAVNEELAQAPQLAQSSGRS